MTLGQIGNIAHWAAIIIGGLILLGIVARIFGFNREAKFPWGSALLGLIGAAILWGWAGIVLQADAAHMSIEQYIPRYLESLADAIDPKKPAPAPVHKARH